MGKLEGKSVSANAQRQEAFAKRQRSAGRARIASWVSMEEATACRNLVSMVRRVVQLAPLATLVGSEKQVKWAHAIRSSMLVNCESLLFGKYISISQANFIKQIHAEMGFELTEQQRAEAYNAVRNTASAHWWIERRCMDSTALVLAACEKFLTPKHEELPSDSENEDANRVIAEATLLPPQKRRGPAIEISHTAMMVQVVVTEFNEEANNLLKKRGFRWNVPAWCRSVDADVAGHRAVEIAIQLLAAGYPVRIFDDALRDRVIAHDYDPEPTRIISISRSEKYGTKFKLLWHGDSSPRDCCWAVKPIRHARIFDDRDGAFVPSSHFDEIEDFAEQNGFVLDKDALDLVADERQKLDGALGLKPRPKRAAAIPSKPALVQATGEIDAELADD